MQIVRTFASAVIAMVVPVAAVAQTTVTINATSGTNVIANGYSTSGGLTLNMGFLMDVLAVGGCGGGSAYNPSVEQYAAAAGGSGIVIVRYQGSPAGTGGTVTSGTGTAAGYTLLTFTTTGSTNLDLSSLNLNTRLGAKVTGVITGNGPLTYNGPGKLILSNNSTFSGSTTITAGTLQLGDGSTQGAINSSAVVNNGTLMLSGSNSFTGDTCVNGGALVISNTRALDPFAIVTTATGGTLQLNQNTRIGYYENNGSLTGSGTLSSAYTLTNTGTLSVPMPTTGAPRACSSGRVARACSGS